MSYTIKEVSEKMNLASSTIRYYDKEGLLPHLERKESGYRVFNDNDIALLEIIECFKNTGLSIKEIRQFCDWIAEGDQSLQQRYDLFLERKQAVEAQLAEMQKCLELVNHKCDYYREALEAGTESIHKKIINRQ